MYWNDPISGRGLDKMTNGGTFEPYFYMVIAMWSGVIGQYYALNETRLLGRGCDKGIFQAWSYFGPSLVSRQTPYHALLPRLVDNAYDIK